MLILEQVLLVGICLIRELPPLAGWGLADEVVSVAKVSFLFD